MSVPEAALAPPPATVPRLVAVSVAGLVAGLVAIPRLIAGLVAATGVRVAGCATPARRAGAAPLAPVAPIRRRTRPIPALTGLRPAAAVGVSP
jgi:hypothetical protein